MDYSNLQDWEINILAQQANLSVEEWKAEQDAKMGKTTVPGETTPPTEPEKKTAAGDSSSADISLESQKPERLGTFIYKGKKQSIFESDYLKLQEQNSDYAGLSFDNYIKGWGGIISETTIAPETRVVGEAKDKARTAIDIATEKTENIAKVNPNTPAVKLDIAIAHFGLVDDGGGNYYVKATERAGKIDEDYNTITATDEEIINYLGEEKANQWFTLRDKAKIRAGGGISKEDLKNLIDLEKVSSETQLNAVIENKKKVSENFDRQYSKEERNEYQRFVGGEEYQDKAQEAYFSGKRAAIEFRNKFNRELIGKTTIQGVTYDPGIFYSVEEWAKGDSPLFGSQVGAADYSDIISDAQKNVQSNLAAQEKVAKDLSDRWKKVQSDILPDSDRLKEIQDKITNVLNTENPTEETLQSYNNLIKEYSEVVNSERYQSLVENWNDLIVETKAHEELVDNLYAKYNKNIDLEISNATALKSFQAMDRAAQVWEEFVLGSGAQLGGQAAYLIGSALESRNEDGTPTEEGFFNDLKSIKSQAVNYNAFLAKRREEGLGRTLTMDDVRDFKNISFSDYLGTTLIENSPSIAIGSLSGYLGVGGAAALTARGMAPALAREIAFKNAGRITGGMFFVSESGGYLSQTELSKLSAKEVLPTLRDKLKEATTGQEIEELEQEINYYESIMDLNEVHKTFNAVGYGLIANYAERLGTTAFFKNLDKYSKAIGYNKFYKLTGSSMKSHLLSKSLGIGAGVATGLGTEILEESLTQVGHNTLDIIAGQEKSLIEGLNEEFFFNVGISSLAMTGPRATGNLYNMVKSELATKQEANKHAKIVDQIFSLQDQLDSGELSRKQYKAVRKEKIKLLKDLDILHASTLLKSGELKKSDLKRVFNINDELRRLRSEALNIGGEKINKKDRKALEEIKEKYTSLINERETLLLSGKNAKWIQSIIDKSANKLETEVNIENYLFNKSLAKQRYGYKNFYTITEPEDIDRIAGNDADLKYKLTQGFIEGHNAFIENGKVYLFEGQISLNLQVGGIEGSRAAASPLHEVGHRETEAAGIIKNDRLVGDAKNLVTQLEKLLKDNLTASQYKDAQRVIEGYKDKKYEETGGVDVSELIELVGDLKTGGYIQSSKFAGLHSFRMFANTAMKLIPGLKNHAPYFRFDTANQINDFIDNWHNAAKRGKRSDIAPKADKEGTKVFEQHQRREAIEKEKGVSKASISASADRAKAALEKKQEDYDPNDYELYEILQGMVSAQLSKYQAKGLQIIDEEEAVADVVSRLYTQRDVNKFDGRGTLYGYLNGRIKFRILDAFKAGPVWIENFGDIDVEGLQGKQAREVAVETKAPATEVEKISDVTPANEYKNLLRRKVVNDEVIKSIEDKILRTVRLLKSRIDAKVSNNVTVTPIIREIKKEIGKQADIDFKKAMGGKKDGELRKFLLRNKAAILENMSTTWLSQAMPIAIQKKVDGIWVSDWQGKKIDREAMSTDLAGRTSGAELIRRLPKAARVISDSDFLATILQPDGNPIRGRKESLAKAMAEEITFDIIKKSFEDNGPIAQAIIENQKRKGVDNAENMGPEFVRQSERGNVKYSRGFYKKLWAYMQASSALDQKDRKALANLAGGNIDSILKSYNIQGRFTLFIGDKKFNKVNDEGITDYINFIINHLAPNIPRQELFPDENTINTSLLYTTASLSNMTDETLKYIQNRIINEVRDGKRPVPGDFNLGVKKDDKGNVIYEEKTVETKFKSFEEFNNAWLQFQKEQGIDIKVKTLKEGVETSKGKRIKPTDLNEEATNNWVWKVYRTRLSKAGNVVELNENNLTRDDNAEEVLAEASNNGDLLIHNVRNEFLYQYIWQNLNNEFQKNLKYETNENGEFILEKGKKIPTKDSANIIRGISTWMHLANSDALHPQRRLAQIVAWQKGFKKGDRTNEHGLPNMAMTQTLIFAMLDNPHLFNNRLRQLQQNYVLIPITKDADKKLNKNFQQSMPADFNIFDNNWWDRSFNEITGKEDLNGESETAGIDPSTYILGGNLKTIAEVADIDKFGKYGQRVTRLFDSVQNTDLEGKITKDSIARLSVMEERLFEDGQRKYSKSFAPPEVLNAQFNAMLSRKSGIDGATEISRARGQILGKDKGRFKFFIAPGADDFRGLVHYAFAGKGKQGEKDMEFFEKNLMDPYFRGIAAIDSMRQLIKREFKVVTKEFKDEYKMLEESVPGTPFTYDHALRVYMWGLAGIEVPGLDKRDLNALENAILDNPALADFAEALLIVGRREAWPKPSEFWLGDSVLADLNSMTEKVGRKDILAQFITNVDAMFDEATLNKIEAIKGRKHREALEDAIYAMKNGSNRPSGANIQTNKWLNWINGSTASIMFVNRRSALLQMLSFTNFINWSDNNPIKAAAAFANQKQYWKDFVFLFNSDKLKERRGGLKQDISESEIAQVASRSKNSPQAVLARILKAGFLPTQIADSFAIATGGATFYRNRVNTYLKQGMSQKKAEEKAFEDFSKASDVAQQSSDPALVSQEQRSILGRLILAFANTPMQYTRLMKKAGQDLINGRGDAKAHISKILYYGAVQNFIFSALQSALFALFFDDDEEDDEKRKRNADQKLLRTVNSMVDTILRGSGIYGAVVSTIKNTIQTYYAQQDKKFMADHTYTVLSALNISPPIGSKFRKLYAAIQTAKFEKDAIAARGWALTADGKLNLGPNWAILGALTSGIGNVPIDRIEAEISSIAEALDARNKAWQRIALALGWKTWDVGAKNEEEDLIETLAKEKRKEEGKKKAAETRRKNQIQKQGEKKIKQDETLKTLEEDKGAFQDKSNKFDIIPPPKVDPNAGPLTREQTDSAKLANWEKAFLEQQKK